MLPLINLHTWGKMNRNYVQLKQALEYTFAYTFAYTSKIYQSFLNLIILESSEKPVTFHKNTVEKRDMKFKIIFELAC